MSRKSFMNIYGICPLSLVAIYSKPNKRSEMTSQLLFGDTFEIIDEEDNWVNIRCSWDNFEGWIHHQQYEEITEQEFQKLQEHTAFSLEVTQPIVGKNHYLPILMGSSLPMYDGINAHYNKQRFTFSGQTIQPKHTKPSADLAIKIARKYLYTPFLFGGRSPFGIDGAGLVQAVFRMMGISMPRQANKQVHNGTLVDFINEVEAGDIAFFENNRGRIKHAGIILPEHQIIHVADRVRIDRIDHYGIYNDTMRRYTHKLRVVKRVLNV